MSSAIEDEPKGTPMHHLKCRESIWHQIWGVDGVYVEPTFPGITLEQVDSLVMPSTDQLDYQLVLV